jgi:geranylgeranyl reductase family protein
MEHWDVVVVGAGPAGSATALAARRAAPDSRVLLLDRADFPRDKSCGDGIAPHVFDALREVGVEDAAAGWTPLRRLRLDRGGSSVERALARPVWVIPRRVFDARLVARATVAGAVLVRHRVREVRPTPEGFLLDNRYVARVVVAADGAHSTVAAATGRGRGRRAVAIRGYAPTPPSRSGRQLIAYGHRRQPSYAWSFDRGDGLSNVGYGELLGDQPGPPSRRVLLEQLEELRPGAAEAGTEWRGHHLPLSGWRWHQPDGALLLVGDAAGLVNPMTGEGIYYAVATGIAAGRAAARAVGTDDARAAGALHRTAVRGLLARHLRHTSVAARLSTFPVVVEAGIRAAARSQRVFDDLVEIGLGRGTITPRLAAGLASRLTVPRHRPHPSVP